MARSMKPKAEHPLLSALKFVSAAQGKGGIGAGYADYCRIEHLSVVTYNGMLSASHPVTVDLTACPHTDRLLLALGRASGVTTYAYSNQVLTLTTGKLKVAVPCIDNRDLDIQHPNPKQVQISQEFIDTLVAASIFTTTGAERVIFAAVLVHEGVTYGTNGQALIQVWHGVPTSGLIVPKQFIDVVKSIKLTPVALGYNNNSMTVHYDTGAWIKTQLYQEEWPIDGTLKQFERFSKAVPVAVDPELFDAIRAVAPHGQDYDAIQIDSEGVHSSGADYSLPMIGHARFNPKLLLPLAESADKIDLFSVKDSILITGKAMRAIVMKMTEKV